MHHEVAVLTPEKVIVSYRLAGVASRTTAHILDLLLCFALVFALSYFVQLLRFIDVGLMMLVQSLVGTFAVFAYFILLEGLWNGQTIGKKATKLRVRMIDGTPVTFAGAVYRNLMRPADFLPSLYMLGLVCMFLNDRAQRIGDMAGGTMVCHEPDAVPQFSPAPHRYGTHPFEQHVGELRGMTQEDYLAMRRLCDRFPELATHVQAQMLKEVWEPFASRHGILPLSGVHPVYLMEAVVMRYGRSHGLV